MSNFQTNVSAPDELWVVIDEDGAPDLAVTYPEAAQEHINDALDTMPEDAADIAKWRSVRYIRADAPKADSALADELAALFDGNLDERFVSYERDSVLAFIVQKRRAIYDVLRAQPGGAVPREPTQAMFDAGYRAIGSAHYSRDPRRGWGEDAVEVWQAMYNAAQDENAQG